ncbi:unnamed protein product [Thlaspi arvense]|uniref:Uncharacterized protein n=1 Tax=Thlaspi arvense TaxID=13288 RepID=A0AAU9T2J9_THLAR|nr:unnamed protein product [Thlaspi arvense]
MTHKGEKNRSELGDGVSFAVVFTMFKRDDYIRTKPDAGFSKWQGFARSMLLRKPFSETAELRRTIADYSSISRDFDPKILIGANDKENLRRGKDRVGRYRVQGSIPGLGVAVTDHEQSRKVEPDDAHVASLGQTESIISRLQPYGRSIAHHDLLKSQRKPGLSQTSQKKTGSRSKDKKHDVAEEREVSSVAAEEKSNVLASILRLTRSKPQSVVSERHDDGIINGSDSAFVCGVLLEDGTTCTRTPIKGRKRCTEHKGQRISCVPVVRKLPCEVPTGSECEETEDICGVILPDMVPCTRKPVSKRKRCEDHKGMRINAFFFLLNPTERDQAVKEDKSKHETSSAGMNKKDPGLSIYCEATTKNGLPCSRIATTGSRRCWQHKDKTLDSRSSENVQSATVSQEICGVKLYNGSVCEKPPVKGRKRCEEHKGMRITS